MSALLGIDLGTSAVKCLLLQPDGSVAARAREPVPILSPAPDRMEQDPREWWRSACRAIRRCLATAPAPTEVAAVGLSGHMSCIAPLDLAHRPLGHAILIGDTRSREQTARLRRERLEQFRRACANEPLDAFAVSKILWLKEEDPGRWGQTATLIFAKDYLRLRLTGDVATDPTDAANSLLLDPETRDWNLPFLEELGLPPRIFPPIRQSLSAGGVITPEAAAETGLPAGTAVITGAADMACSALGTGAIAGDTLAITLSTSVQLVASIPTPAGDAVGRLTHHPHAVGPGCYAMASLFTGGLGVDWCRRLLTGGTGQAGGQALEEAAARLPPGAGGITFLPFLTGSGSPCFNPDRRGQWSGLGLDATPAHLYRAVLEGISFSVRDCLRLFDTSSEKRIVLGGGGSRDRVWRQVLADVLGRDLELLADPDASARGACILAGLHAGIVPDPPSAVARWVSSAETVSYIPEAHRSYEEAFARYLAFCPDRPRRS